MQLMAKLKVREFKKQLLRHNISNIDLAKEIGVTPVYITTICDEKKPKYNPSAKIRKKLLDILKCEFDDLFEIKQKAREEKEPKEKKVKEKKQKVTL